MKKGALSYATAVRNEAAAMAALLKLHEVQKKSQGLPPSADGGTNMGIFKYFPQHNFVYLSNTAGKHRAAVRAGMREKWQRAGLPERIASAPGGAVVVLSSGHPAPLAYVQRLASSTISSSDGPSCTSAPAQPPLVVVIDPSPADAVAACRLNVPAPEALRAMIDAEADPPEGGAPVSLLQPPGPGSVLGVRAGDPMFPVLELLPDASLAAVLMPHPLSQAAAARAHLRQPSARFLDAVHAKLRRGGVFGVTLRDEPYRAPFAAFIRGEISRSSLSLPWAELPQDSAAVQRFRFVDDVADATAGFELWLRKAGDTDSATLRQLAAHDYTRPKLPALVAVG